MAKKIKVTTKTRQRQTKSESTTSTTSTTTTLAGYPYTFIKYERTLLDKIVDWIKEWI